jgi:hypothetical protein
MASEALPLAAEDLALLQRVAARVVEMRLEVPAILMLESVRPLSFVASQAMIFFQPLVQALLHFSDYQRFAALVERRDALETLTALIECRAEESRSARGAAGAGPARGASPTSRGTGGHAGKST